MVLKRSLIVFQKEMREGLRDKRVIYSMIISPLLIFPLIIGLTGQMIGQKMVQAKTEQLTVGLIGSDLAGEFADQVRANKSLVVTEVANVTEATAQLHQGRLRAFVEVPAGFRRQIESEQAAELLIYFDQANEQSRAAKDRLGSVLSQFNEHLVRERLARQNLSANILQPAEFKEKNLADSNGIGVLLMSIMLPYILVMMGFLGGTSIAFDTVAGEKERGTLETLLLSPADRGEIVLGKFLAVVAACTVSVTCAIAGLVFAFRSGLPIFSLMGESKVTISAFSIVLIFVIMIPLTTLFAAVLLAISSFARNQKEAGTLLLPLTLLVLIPSTLSLVFGADTSLSSSLIPIVNVVFLIKQALVGNFQRGFIVLAFASTLVYAGSALTLTRALFNREEVLFRS